MIELLVATASASILMVGLVSALAISARCFQVHPTNERIELSQSTHDLARLAEAATHLPAHSPGSIQMLVPDRDADNVDELIAVGFNSATGPNVNLSRNGGDDVPAIESVATFTAQTHPITLPSKNLPALEQVRYVAVSESKVENEETIMVQQPPGCEVGNLLILVVAAHGDHKKSMRAGAWNKLDVLRNKHVTLGIWWRIAASSSGNHSAIWSDREDAYAAMLAFSGHDSGYPIGAVSFFLTSGANPLISSIDTIVDESMVLCVGAFHKDEIRTDNCGVDSAYSVTMDHSNGQISVGTAIAPVPVAGNFPSRSFALTDSEDYITAAIVINARQ
ncbi:MAG: hypothetical protein Aurels2KO_46170 [Aureliella sp.]